MSSPSKKPTTRPKPITRRTSDPSEPVFQEDGPLVGTRDILTSPNVIEPTISTYNINGKPIPTPSIYTDARGQIINLLVGDDKHGSNNNDNNTTTVTRGGETTSQDPKPPKRGKRINIVKTSKGAMRSGDLHPNTQCSFVFEGSIEVWIPQSDGTTKKFTLGPRDYFEVPSYVPHVECFLEDTIHAEWWEANDSNGVNGFQHWFYAPYRRLVDMSFDWGHGDQPRGTLKLLRESKHRIIEDEETNVKENESNGNYSIHQLLLVIGGVAMCGLGFVLGKMQQSTRR